MNTDASNNKVEPSDKAKLSRTWRSAVQRFTGWYDDMQDTTSKQKDEQWALEADDLMLSSRGDSKLLSKYSLEDLEHYCQSLGLNDALKQKGINDFFITIDTGDDFVHKFFIWLGPKDVNAAHKMEDKRLLVELVLRRVTNVVVLKNYGKSINMIISAVTDLSQLANMEDSRAKRLIDTLQKALKCMKSLESLSEPDFIIIEWMKMQDPRRELSPYEQSQLLPGQDYPSLGIAKVFHEALIHLAHKAERDAFINIPLYLHNAIFYHNAGYKFINPVFEAFFRVFLKHFAKEIKQDGILRLSMAVLRGELYIKSQNGTKTKVIWKGEEMALPISQRFEDYFVKNEKNFEDCVKSMTAEVKGFAFVIEESDIDANEVPGKPFFDVMFRSLFKLEG
ncbi:hypothetical protein MP638_003347 [Amoeboaphelidium occidentale]|nr:hypothetical protein MP638_003347 [Amoeboaphelidium occidentale]